MDELDRRIIGALDFNSRTPNTGIAKICKITKQLLRYRLERLEKEGIIEKCYTLVNTVKLGMMYFRIYIKTQGLDSKSENELIERFRSNQYTSWVITTRGKWDLIVSMYATDVEQFSTDFSSILGDFQKNIHSKNIVTIRNVIFSTRDYLDKGTKSNSAIYGGASENNLIDDLDHQILKELAKNSRARITELSKKVNSNPETVSSRIEKLEKKEIIKGHKLTLDYSKFGILFFILSINLSNASVDMRRKIEKFCSFHPNVIYYVNIIGNQDIELEVETLEYEELDKLIRDIKNTFQSEVRDIEVLQITKQHKLDYYPFKENPTRLKLPKH
ncbi:AsnC family transcriptional regulator [Candidatus Micrarchaeota archaeon]|nr:AsnC family transcriptional regulator [Candidatus Micrarchaeota archaeon]